MIAKISNTFGSNVTLSEKISYNISKIEDGKGEYLYDNFFQNDIYKLYDEMKEVGMMNDRVKNKYVEITLNLTPEEKLDKAIFLKLANEYLLSLGYGNCCYAVILHTDREHRHLHILTTTVDYNSLHIPDSNIKLRSLSLSRELEVKYGLKELEYKKFKNQRLSKIKEREYYFSNALDRGIRNFSTKTELLILLEDNAKLVQDNRLTNLQLELLLGKDLYKEVGEVLEKNNLFVSLYKDELLQQLDSCYNLSNNKYDFFEKVHAAGLYVRTIGDKNGKLKLTYGLPNANIYFKDERLPQKYRYAALSNFETTKTLSREEQQSSIASKAIVALKNINSFESYLAELEKIGVVATLHENSGGIYGMSFKLKDVEDAIIFKASEITTNRAFSYANITKYFSGEVTPLNDFSKGNGKVKISFTMKEEEQKTFIRNQVRQTLPTVNSAEELREKLSEKGISLWLRKNNKGEIKGFSFKLFDCANALPIKASDVSANFDKELFRGVQALHAGSEIESFERFTRHESKEKQLDSIVSNNPSIPQQPAEFSVISAGAGDLQNDDELLSKKKMKKKNDMDFGR
jgi:hypothetical protein